MRTSVFLQLVFMKWSRFFGVLFRETATLIKARNIISVHRLGLKVNNMQNLQPEAGKRQFSYIKFPPFTTHMNSPFRKLIVQLTNITATVSVDIYIKKDNNFLIWRGHRNFERKLNVSYNQELPSQREVIQRSRNSWLLLQL